MLEFSTLKKRALFLKVAAQGNNIATKGLVLQALKSNEHEDSCGLGFTVSKKVGNAVVRNRVKRRLRAVASKTMEGLAKPGIDYVIIGRQAAITRDFLDLVKDLKYALHNIH